MGCGALSQSMPSGHMEGGVSTRKTPADHPLYARLMRKKSSSAAQALLRGPNGCGFEKGGSGLWAQRTTNSSSSSTSLPSFTRAGSLPSVMPEADDHPTETQGVASCSSIAASMSSSTSNLPVSVSAPTTSKLGSERTHFVGPPPASNTTCVPSSEASLQGSVSPPTSAGSTSDREDLSGWEPPASSTVTRLKSGEADQTSSHRSSRCRSRASPLGALAEPLAPHRSSLSGGAVDLQATALRPSVAEDWWQADLRNGAEERSSLQVPFGQHVIGDRGRKSSPKQSAGQISNDSLEDIQSGDLSASGPASVPIYAARPTTRKGSETEGSVHSASLVSVISTDTAVETDTLHESAASDSLPENTSRSHHSDFPEDSLLGTEPSEPPDTSSNFAECSTYSEVASIEDDHLSLSFMLERPFAGLETILEEEGDVDDTGLKLPRSCSNSSVHTQVRSSCSKRTVCVGPLGDPTAMWWPLSSPEPLSSELLRTSPCAEGMGTLSEH